VAGLSLRRASGIGDRDADHAPAGRRPPASERRLVLVGPGVPPEAYRPHARGVRDRRSLRAPSTHRRVPGLPGVGDVVPVALPSRRSGRPPPELRP